MEAPISSRNSHEELPSRLLLMRANGSCYIAPRGAPRCLMKAPRELLMKAASGHLFEAISRTLLEVPPYEVT